MLLTYVISVVTLLALPTSSPAPASNLSPDQVTTLSAMVEATLYERNRLIELKTEQAAMQKRSGINTRSRTSYYQVCQRRIADLRACREYHLPCLGDGGCPVGHPDSDLTFSEVVEIVDARRVLVRLEDYSAYALVGLPSTTGMADGDRLPIFSKDVLVYTGTKKNGSHTVREYKKVDQQVIDEYLKFCKDGRLRKVAMEWDKEQSAKKKPRTTR